jgi:hypothetical protein
MSAALVEVVIESYCNLLLCSLGDKIRSRTLRVLISRSDVQVYTYKNKPAS